MGNISETGPLSKRDLFYFRERQKNRVFTQICSFFVDEAKGRGITKRALAERIGCDPAQITRWLSSPSNMTLDTISDLLLALGAEMDQRIVKFEDRPKANAIHPLARTSARPANRVVFDKSATYAAPRDGTNKVSQPTFSRAMEEA